MNNKILIWVGAIIVVALLLWVIISYVIEQRTEELKYELLESDKEYEIRKYSDYIVAETNVEGEFVESGNEAFGVLAGYIFGGNEKQESIAMTTPVISDPGSETIAMTTPVIKDENKYAFVMPAKYTLETLPKPKDSRVIIKKGEPMKVAVLKFSGFFNDKNYDQHKEELKTYLERDGLKYSRIISAGHSPPWTPFFMKRLEVWAVLQN